MNPDNSSPLPVVLLHGLLSTPQEFGLIGLSLNTRGLRLVVPEIPGYTLADRGQPRGWQQWASAAWAAIEEALPEGRFVIGGLCSGGLLAAALAHAHPERVAGLVLMSPTFDYDGWSQSGWRHFRGVGYALGLGRLVQIPEREPFGVKNPKIRKWIERDMRERASSAAGPATLPLWAVREVDRVSRHVRRVLPSLRMRSLWLHAREDEICTLKSVRAAFGRLGADDKHMVVLEDSYHMITIDNDRHRVASELHQFASAQPAPRLAPVPVALPVAQPQPRNAGLAVGLELPAAA